MRAGSQREWRKSFPGTLGREGGKERGRKGGREEKRKGGREEMRDGTFFDVRARLCHVLFKYGPNSYTSHRNGGLALFPQVFQEGLQGACGGREGGRGGGMEGWEEGGKISERRPCAWMKGNAGQALRLFAMLFKAHPSSPLSLPPSLPPSSPSVEACTVTPRESVSRLPITSVMSRMTWRKEGREGGKGETVVRKRRKRDRRMEEGQEGRKGGRDGGKKMEGRKGPEGDAGQADITIHALGKEELESR